MIASKDTAGWLSRWLVPGLVLLLVLVTASLGVILLIPKARDHKQKGDDQQDLGQNEKPGQEQEPGQEQKIEIRDLGRYPGMVFCLAFSPDGESLAIGAGPAVPADFFPPEAGALGEARVIDLRTGRTRYQFRPFRHLVSDVAFSQDGKILAAAGWEKVDESDQAASGPGSRSLNEGQVKLWDTATGKEKGTLKSHKDEIRTVAFTADGKTVITSSLDQTVKLWDVGTMDLRLTIQPDSKLTRSSNVVISPDGRYLAWASSELVNLLQKAPPVVQVWDSVDKTIKSTFAAPPAKNLQSIAVVAFLPDGKRLVSGDDNDMVLLWNLGSGKVESTFKGHEGRIMSLAVDPNGKLVASGSTDGTVMLWSIAEQKELFMLKHREHLQVVSVAFSPDGKKLASAGVFPQLPSEIKLWDVATGKDISLPR